MDILVLDDNNNVTYFVNKSQFGSGQFTLTKSGVGQAVLRQTAMLESQGIQITGKIEADSSLFAKNNGLSDYIFSVILEIAFGFNIIFPFYQHYYLFSGYLIRKRGLFF